MRKQELGPQTYLFPMPVVLVGANVKDKPNYMTAAFCAVVNYDPVVFALGLGAKHFTNIGIKANKTFSINIPSAALAEATDYCGIHSGKSRDKSALFTSFYGRLETAPMISECPVNYECELVKISDDFSPDELVLGRLIQAYADEKCLVDGCPDLSKIKPLLLTMPDNQYWTTGKKVAKAWSAGKNFKPKKHGLGG
jgi:flavin reductase (DIM6/NTAB) family NADH-FMN oxidoreductase RutF